MQALRERRVGPTILATLLFSLLSHSAAADGAKCAGVIVAERLGAPSASGPDLRVGDRLRSWRLLDPSVAPEKDAAGSICSVFDYWRFTMELRPRGALELVGERDGKPISWQFEPGPWAGIVARSWFTGELARLWEEALPLRDISSPEATVAWKALLQEAEASRPKADQVWLLSERGFSLSKHVDPVLGDEILARGQRLVEDEWPWIAAHIQQTRGDALAASDPAASVAHLEGARDAWLKIGDELSAANASQLLGLTAMDRWELEVVERHLVEDVRLRTRWSPRSASLAIAHSNLAVAYFHLGRAGEAIDHLDQARSILQHYPPSARLSQVLANLASLYGVQGQADRQLGAAVEALDLVRKLGAKPLIQYNALMNLANARMAYGDLAEAESLAREAILAAEEGGDRAKIAHIYLTLGSIAEQRGNMTAAAQNYQQTIDLLVALESPSPEVALAAMSLGSVLTKNGSLETAEKSFERAARHLAEHTPEHPYNTTLHAYWADLLLAQGRANEALAKADRGVETAQRTEIGGHYLLIVRLARGRALLALDRIDEALQEARGTLVLARRAQPGTPFEVQALTALGQIEVRRGRRKEAEAAFCQGVDVLEGQIDRLGGGNDDDSRFRSQNLDVFESCAEARWTLGDPQGAFHILERSRAWKTRQALTERGLVVRSAVGGDLETRFRALAIRHDQVLEGLAAADSKERADLRSRLAELATEREELLAEARSADPRFAAIAYPTPLTAAQAADRLEPDELLIAFEITAETTLAFRLEPTGRVRGYRLGRGTADLSDEVDEFLAAIQERADDKGIREQAARLWARLLAPVLDGAPAPRRLILILDGPLLRLPWSALGHTDSTGHWRWTIEDHRVVVVPSATVLSELANRPAAEGRRVAAFGNPAFDGEIDPSANGLRSLLKLRGKLPALPGTRKEIEAIASTFGRDRVELFTGPTASETNARRLGSGHRIVHFASHALLDEIHPLESGLVLSPPDELEAGVDNGFLQAWEIIDGLELDAELVTLSACSTARGTELRGEGIIGLSRAFLHAGARSVIATLWPVADQSTARLMAVFYRQLAAGATRDEALRRAQLELLRGGDADVPDVEEQPDRGVGGLASGPAVQADSSPFYWAAFRLVGDPG